LLYVEHLLYQSPTGLKVEEIARSCGVSKRTTYRDLRALETELKVPIWEEGTQRGIVEGYFLPPISFSVPEALNVFLAARLMLSYARGYDPNIASVFLKLNSIVHPPLREQIQKTLEWMQKQPKDDRYLRTQATLAEAWLSRQKVKIAERIIEPYFIEPAAAGHSSYVIAYCHRAHEIRTFKVERIEAIEMTSEPYTVPHDFDANEFFGSSWGIVVEAEVETIKLKILTPEIVRIMQETIWHPSQVLERQSDGSMVMTLRVADTYELRGWILSWGEQIEVLEPEELRRGIIETAKAMLDIYKK
jgi:predicted DNA-binding transcriptional regulator YafY